MRTRATQTLRLWWRMAVLCRRRGPWLSLAVLSCLALQIVAMPLIGVALRALVDGTAAGDTTAVLWGAAGAGIAYAAQATLEDLGMSARLTLVGQVGMLDVLPATLSTLTRLPTLEHLELPDHLDRVELVRTRPYALPDWAWAVVESGALVVRLVLTVALLGTVDPALLGLVVVAAVPMILERVGRRTRTACELAAAAPERVERALLRLSTQPGPGHELRVAGAGDELLRRRRTAWRELTRLQVRGQVVDAAWASAGWLIFGLGFVAALALVVARSSGSAHGAGDLVLTVTVAVQLRAAVEGAVRRAADTASFARVIEAERWLQTYRTAAEARAVGTRPAPTRLVHGLTLDHLSYTYPGAERPAVDAVTAHLPAGSVVAVVGEFGSGKTTLVKLLAGLYTPTSGAVLVDAPKDPQGADGGTPLAEIDPEAWRRCLSAAFQDFGRYCLPVDESVWLGDLTGWGDEERLAAALREAQADGFVARLPQGARTEVGAALGGVELSEGQWQRTALARSGLRADPVLFLLDEPTASLDAPSEQAVFERYTARAREAAARTGRVTIVVSHRFSTVAGADLILVMERGRLVESGAHDELMARAGVYAELYGMQAEAYLRPVSEL